MSDRRDRERLRRAAAGVGTWVALASIVVFGAVMAILAAVVLLSARTEEHGAGSHEHGGDLDRVVVDVDHLLPWLVGLSLGGALVLALIAWFAARRAVRPLAEALRLQRAFVSDAGHELRTPLTALSSRIQLLQRRAQRGEQIDEVLIRLRADVAALDDTLGDMLLAAEGERVTGESSRVSAAIGDAIDLLGALADENGVVLRRESDQALSAAVPSATLTRLCVALIDNAIQHSPRGGAVTVTAQPEGDSVRIRVVDGGEGIAEQDRERIFERFARGAETGRRRGFGLGLALVREASERYGGSVQLEHTSPSGSVFALTLPRSSPG